MIPALWSLLAVLWLLGAVMLCTYDRYGLAAILLLICCACVGVALMPP